MFTHTSYKETHFDPAFETQMGAWIVSWELTALAYFDIAKETKM